MIYYGEKRKASELLERKIAYDEKMVAEYNLKKVSFLRIPWGKLYKSSVIKEHWIRFDEKLTLGEDTLFNYNYVRFIHSFSILPDSYLYNYQEIQSNEKNKRYYKSASFICNSRKKMFNGYCEIFRYKKLYEKFLSYISNNCIHSFIEYH